MEDDKTHNEFERTKGDPLWVRVWVQVITVSIPIFLISLAILFIQPFRSWLVEIVAQIFI